MEEVRHVVEFEGENVRGREVSGLLGRGEGRGNFGVLLESRVAFQRGSLPL